VTEVTEALMSVMPQEARAFPLPVTRNLAPLRQMTQIGSFAPPGRDGNKSGLVRCALQPEVDFGA